jgi:hypothetical protein
MKKNPKNQDTAPQKEDSITKKNDGLGEDELNKVTGGKVVLHVRKAGGEPTEFLR